MNTLDLLLVAVATLAVLGFVWALLGKLKAEARASALLAEVRAADISLARLEERAHHIDTASAKVAETFEAMSAKAVDSAAAALLARAEESFQARDRLVQARIETTLKPVTDKLTEFHEKVQLLEAARLRDSGGLTAQITQLLDASQATQTEARKLSDALKRAPNVRGRWGEQSLRNVLEACGLNGRFDFIEQHTVEGEAGNALRPDAIVRLAGGGVIVLDSKVNLNPYMDSLAASDDLTRAAAVERFVKGFKGHVDDLAKKAYWDQFKKPPFDRSPGFVVMFVPGENFLCTALDAHPSIMDDARQNRVLIASPTSLFALLQTVALGWRAEDQAHNVKEIADLGRDLYGRIATMTEHVEAVGSNLGRAVSKYNALVGSLKDRVIPQARKFEAFAADHQSKRLVDLTEIETTPKAMIDAPRIAEVG